MLSYDRQLALV